jgi:hypothetical protein
VTPPAPLDPRRKAFAQGLGHLLGELVWREIVGADSQNRNEGGDLAPKDDDARRLAGCEADAVEVDHASM